MNLARPMAATKGKKINWPPMNADKRRSEHKKLRLQAIDYKGDPSESSRFAKNLRISSTDKKTLDFICVNPCSSVAGFVFFTASLRAF
jgi:hypothetical protein